MKTILVDVSSIAPGAVITWDTGLLLEVVDAVAVGVKDRVIIAGWAYPVGKYEERIKTDGTLFRYDQQLELVVPE